MASAAARVLRTVQRDAAARITGYTHTGSGATGLDQTFAYDNLNRLTAATQGTASTSYSYDATGNRTLKTVAGTGYTNTVSPTSNRLTQVSTPSGTASIGHDAAGNVTADGSATFSYSDRGRMASATTSAGTVNYLYDGRNQRVKKSGPSSLVNTGEAYYVYDEAGQLLGEYDASGNPVYETIYLGSIPVGAMKQAGSAANNDLTTSLYNIHADHIDTPRVITRQDHTIVWRWDTAEAFGSTAPNQNPSGLGTFVFNQRFPGQVFDQETGLNQNWNRDYDPWIGRYRQFDPLGLAAGINGFLYAGGAPTIAADPTGLFESHWLLRALVPGQVAFDNAMTARERGNYGAAAVSTIAMSGEIVLAGTGLRAAAQACTHVVDSAVSNLARSQAGANLGKVLSEVARKKAGFSGTGVPIILDENLAARGMAEALRAQGYNVRSVVEIFGQHGVKDPTIRQFAESIGARVLTADRGRQIGEGFGRLAINVPGRAGTNVEAISRLLSEALK